MIEKADRTVYGDGVNIAARLEGLAEPGGIILSDMVRNGENLPGPILYSSSTS